MLCKASCSAPYHVWSLVRRVSHDPRRQTPCVDQSNPRHLVRLGKSTPFCMIPGGTYNLGLPCIASVVGISTSNTMNSTTDRFLGGCAKGNAAAIDTELRLGLQQCEAQRPYLCSLCTRSFTSLQTLAGHQMVHRWEVEKLRRKHQAFLARSTAAVRLLDRVAGNASDLQPPREKKQPAVDEEEEAQEEEEEEEDEEGDGSVDLELKLRAGGLDLSLRL
ncbi:hypothetical protein GW17_00022032 [Ensete ventricosum]|nr:hypothetical protein GW17_00022032 [Ensete ventricosum]